MALQVVAAVIEDAAGRVLVARRPEGKAEAGRWEFPGGKREAGEDALAALARELREELGLRGFASAELLIRVPLAGPDGALRLTLDAWRLRGVQGVPEAREHSALAWCRPQELVTWPMPPADRPVVAALCAPSSCLITPEPGPGEAAAAAWLSGIRSALNAGVRRVQLRVSDPARRRRLAPGLQAACAEAGAELLVNHDAALAEALGLGLHLRSADLASAGSEPPQGPFRRALAARKAAGLPCSASAHDTRELVLAEALGLDFALLGPVQPTGSHPGAAALGWAGFQALRARVPGLPVYALGGLHPLGDAATARRHGAQGVAGIRGFLDQR